MSNSGNKTPPQINPEKENNKGKEKENNEKSKVEQGDIKKLLQGVQTGGGKKLTVQEAVEKLKYSHEFSLEDLQALNEEVMSQYKTKSSNLGLSAEIKKHQAVDISSVGVTFDDSYNDDDEVVELDDEDDEPEEAENDTKQTPQNSKKKVQDDDFDNDGRSEYAPLRPEITFKELKNLESIDI